MSTGSSIAADLSELALLPPARFTSEQYVQMIASGILGPSDRVELIDEVITPMAPAGPEHKSSLMQFTRMFTPVLDRFEILDQGTEKLGDQQVFDPDFVLLNRDKNRYRDRHPTGNDIRLVIESAASSLKKDLEKKLPVYAAAEIEEYWVLDLEQEVLQVHRDPYAAAYRSVELLKGDESISPLACPDLTIAVADLFH